MYCHCGGAQCRAEFESMRGRVITVTCLFCFSQETELRSRRNNLLMWKYRRLEREQVVNHLEMVGMRFRIPEVRV